MNLNSKIRIINRTLINHNIPVNTRYKSAILTILKSASEDTVYLLILTDKEKKGTSTRYKIKDNVEKAFTRFINEGKTTIRFKDPPHDLNILADKTELQEFLGYMNKVWKNEIQNIPALCPINLPKFKKVKNITKMEISKKSEYPVLQRFPNTLEILSTCDCHLKRFDKRILDLKNLTALSLDRNAIKEIPFKLSEKPLKFLSLSQNNLGKNLSSWDFLSGTLSTTLEYLNISHNQINFFPMQLAKFKNLKVLKLRHIYVDKLPSAIFLLPKLQELDLSENKLKALPGAISFRHGKFDKLNIAETEIFSETEESKNLIQSNNNIYTLLELSLRVVADKRIPCDSKTVPHHLVRLLNHVNYCWCRKSCFKNFGPVYSTVDLSSYANTLVSSYHEHVANIMFHACSLQHTIILRLRQIQ